MMIKKEYSYKTSYKAGLVYDQSLLRIRKNQKVTLKKPESLFEGKIMSAVLEVWASELAKLKEKVRTRMPFLSETRERDVQEEKRVKKERKVALRETTMSETTVCLLMERFVTW